MEWLKNLWKSIVESDNQKYIDKIKELELKNNIVISENEDLFQKLANTNELLALKVIEVAKLKVNNKKISDLLKPCNITYKWKPTKNTLLRHSLNNFSDDVEYKAKYFNWLIQQGINPEFKTEEEAIIKTTLLVLTWWKKNKKYIADTKSDYWLTPQEAFDQIIMGELKGEDCDGLRAIIYGSVVSVLDTNGYSIDNLFACDVNIIGSEGHAILQWWNGKQFLTLETTFAPERAYKVWSSERDITKSVYTDVMRFFNEKQEYKLK